MQPFDKLEMKLSWVYLINLVFFIIPLFTMRFELWQYLAMAMALLVFLYCFFWAYRSNRSDMAKPIAGIVVVATLITPVNYGAIALFAYAGFFIGYAYRWPRYLLLMTMLIVHLVLLYVLLGIQWELFLFMGVPMVLGVSLLGRVEQAKQRQRETERQSADEIKQLATMVERERIGRDLHDILGHTLSSIILKADLADKLLARQQTEAARQQLSELNQIARDALSQVRQSVSGFKHQGLTAEVTKLLNRLRDAGFQAELHGELPSMDPRRETAVVLALTELVTNIMRHSKGDSCQLGFVQRGNQLHIHLSDNGRCSELKEGNGITGLRERLAAISASLTFEQGDGTTARILLPLQEQTQ